MPELARYVNGWGRPSDLGVIASWHGEPVGAAWLRLLVGDDAAYGYVDDSTPEPGDRRQPARTGQGIGGALLKRLLLDAERMFAAVSLSVRDDNPARPSTSASGSGRSMAAVRRTGWVVRRSPWSAASLPAEPGEQRGLDFAIGGLRQGRHTGLATSRAAECSEPRGVRVQSAATAAGRAARRRLLPGGRAAVPPADAAADAVGGAHPQPRGAVPHPRRHRHRNGRVRRRLRGDHATRAVEFGYPPGTRSVGVHFKPWGLAPFLPMPAAELCDRPVTVEQVWGRPAVAELRDRLAAAAGPHEMLTLLEDELVRRLCETSGLGLVRHTSTVIAASAGAVAIGELSAATGVSSTHLAQRFKELIGVTPKRIARTYRFAAAVLAVDPAEAGRLGRPRESGRLLRPGPLRPRVPGVHGAHPDPVPRCPAAVPAEHPGHALDVGPLPAD